MTTVILATGTRYILPLMLLFSIFLLLRGHNDPGGGFVGGLVAASAFALYAIAYNVQDARAALRVDPRTLIGVGLLCIIISGLLALFTNQPFLTGLWLDTPVPVLGKVGTPVLFDTGVYLGVVGVTLTIIFSLAESE